MPTTVKAHHPSELVLIVPGVLPVLFELDKVKLVLEPGLENTRLGEFVEVVVLKVIVPNA